MTPGEGAAKFEHIFPPFGVGDPSHLYLWYSGTDRFFFQILDWTLARRYKSKEASALGGSLTTNSQYVKKVNTVIVWTTGLIT